MRTLNLLSLLLVGILGFGQGQWELINPYPLVDNLTGVSFGSPDTGWIIGSGGNLIKTVNGGEGWEFQKENTGDNFRDIIFVDENEGWVCTGAKKIFHTPDGGATWETQYLPGQYLSTASIFFINAETGWACGSYDRIFKTVNGGATWLTVHSGYYTEATYLEDIEFYDENHGIAVGGYIVGNDTAVILTTQDGGQNWNKKTFPNHKRLKKAYFLSGNTIVAVGVYGVVFRTTDGGETWTTQDIGSSLSDVYFFDEMNGIALGSYKVMHTHDGGISWEEGAYLSADHFTFKGSTGYAVNYQSDIYKTVDSGYVWNRISKRMQIGNLTNAAFADTLHIWACRQNDTQLVTTSDGGYNWSSVNIGASGDILDVCFPSPNVGYAIEKTEKINRTTDGGENWEEIHIGNNFQFYCFGFESENKGYLGGKSGLLLRTTSSGQIWVNISPTTEGDFIDIRLLGNGKLWALNSLGSVFYSDNSGASWEEKATGAFGNLTGFYFFDENHGFVFTEYGEEYKTYDGGETWEMEAIFNPYPYPLKIAFFDENDGWLLRGSVLYFTPDMGETWINVPASYGMQEMVFLPPYTGLICGYNSLIMKYHKTPASIPEIELQHSLVYPNPASSLAHIHLNKKHLYKDLVLTATDLMGRKKYQQTVKLSKNEIIIDVGSWEKGMYFITIQDGDKVTGRAKLMVQ